MKNDRRLLLKALAALPLAAALPARADSLETVRQRGRLRIAVYNDFSPYAMAGGKGIDAEIGRAIAAKLGLAPEVVGYTAGEDMNDDLRNMVWKGHYLGTPPADVMMHVPVDEYLAKNNDKVRIFGPYHRETLALARNPERVPALSGSAAVALEIFTREKIGVETATLADAFLLGVLNGRLRENVVHFPTVAEAAKGLQAGKVSAVLATRAELEAALAGGAGQVVIDQPKFAELKIDGWPLGMAVKADEGELAEAIAKALAELKQDGTVAAIFKRYGVSYQPV
jgi:ABC-type amino acid transport substrate-binding protein